MELNYPIVDEVTSGFFIPTKFTLVAGSAEGKTKLTAFDKALLSAGVGNMNLLKVSSILPPGVDYQPKALVQPGAPLLIAYSFVISDQIGGLISAAVAVGISFKEEYGVIMEFSGACSKEEAERVALEMVKEAFEARNMPLNEILVKGIDHKVERIGCVFAGVPLWS